MCTVYRFLFIHNKSIRFCSQLSTRFNTTSYAVEFISDGNNDTFWRSVTNESPVIVQLQLDQTTNLSKIFIFFESPLPLSAELEYLNENSMWSPLQYWADNCNERFGLENNGM